MHLLCIQELLLEDELKPQTERMAHHLSVKPVSKLEERKSLHRLLIDLGKK